MKIVFAGPSLHGVVHDRSGLIVRPPAAQGDILRAVRDGAQSIGLIDGVFASSAAVWHKEILYALSQDVQVLGASSMGAIRAAECAAFGMVPVGRIAGDFCRGALDDDAAVALVFGPAELDYCPLSEPLVDVDDKAERLCASGVMTAGEGEDLREAARAMHFADRGAETLFARAYSHADRRAFLLRQYVAMRPSAKQRDAVELLERIRTHSAHPEPRNWQMHQAPIWSQTLARSR